MGLQYGDDDDDLFDSSDEDDEESESELSAEPPAKPTPIAQARQSVMRREAGGRRIRMRPMKPSMAEKHPDVVSILLTRNDGRQLLFVRK